MVSTYVISAEMSVKFRWWGLQTKTTVPHSYFQRNIKLFLKHRYKIHNKVKDDDGKTALVLFNRVAKN